MKNKFMEISDLGRSPQIPPLERYGDLDAQGTGNAAETLKVPLGEAREAELPRFSTKVAGQQLFAFQQPILY